MEKFSYLAAVRCLQSIPAKSRATIPGALNRFDDFSGTHILQTDDIHFVVSTSKLITGRISAHLLAYTGSLPAMAQILPQHIREGSQARVWLHGGAAVSYILPTLLRRVKTHGI